MASSLTDRYVAVALRHVSSKQRKEVDQELRAALADDVAARMADGESEERAEYAAISEMGNPALLATQYADQKHTLIGPTTYPWYKKAIMFLLPVVVVATYVFSAVGHGMRHENFGAIIFGPIGPAITAAAYGFSLITLIFIILDKQKNQPGENWKPEDLS